MRSELDSTSLPLSASQRGNLSEDLAAELRDHIVDGEIPAGERINEVHLAARLEVSRTPLREALKQLVSEGFLMVLPRRGFFVRGLHAEEFEHLYRIRAILDPAALEAAGLPDTKQLDELEALNRELAPVRDPNQAIALDDRWHHLLLSHCPNPILLDLITQFMRRTRRYEHAYMRQQAHVRIAVEEHEKILDALRVGDLSAGCTALRQNMTSGQDPILRWLRDLCPETEP